MSKNLFPKEQLFDEDAITVEFEYVSPKENTGITKKHFYSSLDAIIFNYLSDTNDFDPTCKVVLG